MKILIVDDERIVLNGISSLLQKQLSFTFPLDIVTATNVPEALNILQTFTPHLLLTDIRMPVMDGFALIDEVKRQNIPCSIAILTSHTDFSYAHRAIKYNVVDFILKPIDENILQNLILQEQKRIKSLQRSDQEKELLNVRSILLYDFPPSELFLNNMIIQNMFPYEYYTVHILEFTSAYLPDKTLLLDLFSKFYKKCYCFDFYQKQQIVFLGNHSNFRIDMDSLYQQERALCNSYGEIYSAFSIVSNSIQDLFSIYSNAYQKIFCLKAFGNDAAAAYLSMFTYQDCASLFSEPNEIEFARKLDWLFGLLTVDESTTPEALKHIYKSLAVNIKIYLETLGMDFPLPKSTDPVPYKSVQDLRAAVSEIVTEARNNIQQDFTNYSANSLVHKLLNYIAQNYQYDISLENVADAVNMHPNYVCTLFKKRLGKSFLTLLHEQRINASKKLMNNPDLLLEQIALQSGFSSANQFSRIFKKYESISPTQYRKSK